MAGFFLWPQRNENPGRNIRGPDFPVLAKGRQTEKPGTGFPETGSQGDK